MTLAFHPPGERHTRAIENQPVQLRIRKDRAAGRQHRLSGLARLSSLGFVGDTAAAAMNFLANSDSVIIDLRQNGGGDPATVALICSYLFSPEPVHLNDLYFRSSNENSSMVDSAVCSRQAADR